MLAIFKQTLSLDHDITKEKLVIKGTTSQYGPMTISRYPMGATEEWIEEMAKYADADGRNQYRTIRICLY
jgi:hypothetical protein